MSTSKPARRKPKRLASFSAAGPYANVHPPTSSESAGPEQMAGRSGPGKVTANGRGTCYNHGCLDRSQSIRLLLNFIKP